MPGKMSGKLTGKIPANRQVGQWLNQPQTDVNLKSQKIKEFALLAFAFLVSIAMLLAVLGASAAFAEDAGAPKPILPDVAKDLAKKKSTEVSFDDVLVQGKYHFSDEAVTTVEDDKILDALLGVRTDFKDRIKKSTARQ